MKIKFLLILFVLLGCRSVDKSSSSESIQRNEVEVIQSDSIVSVSNQTENTQWNTVYLSDMNFRIIPSKKDTMARAYAFTDKNGNTVSGTINPNDTVEFRQNTVTVDQFNQMKELKEYYEQRALSAEKRLEQNIQSSETDVERKPQPMKWIMVLICLLGIGYLAYNFFKK